MPAPIVPYECCACGAKCSARLDHVQAMIKLCKGCLEKRMKGTK